MVEKADTVSADGVKSDGVSFYPASPEQLQSFRDASEALSRFHAPILAHAGNLHERVFMAAFDGTGNDADKDPEHATNIDKIRKQVEALSESGEKQVHVEYLAGPGTQDNKWARIWDGARGHTYETRLEEMYTRLVKQANKWEKFDPDVEIRVQVIGFSRGASQAAGFTRLLHERGIVDPKSAIEHAGPNGEPVIEYTDHIVPPGKTPQTVGLFDPVATGVPMNFDRRLPPSVVSGFQITAADERRGKFPSDRIIPMGFSEDGRFLNVAVAGAHSDIGGGYLRNGMSLRCCNLMLDYLNSGRDTPLLEKYYEPTDPRYAVIHRSEEGLLLYKVDHKINRLEPGGYTEQQQPRSAPDAAPLPHRPEAADAVLREKLAYRPITIGETPSVPEIALAPLPDAGFEAVPRGLGAAEVVRGLGVVAAADLLRDSATTAGRVSDLRQQHNETGAQSNILHFEGRNLGALGGAIAGAELFGIAGAETGPFDLLVAAAGAGVGAYYGNKWADKHDQAQIYNQTDPQGISWHYDPKHPEQGWTRDLPPLPQTPHGQHFTADPVLAERLDFQASNKAAELAMAYAPTPQDPYAQPAGEGDTHSVDDARWVRDVASRTWSRQVVDQRLEHGMVRSHVETATPARAAQLDQAAEQTIAQNLAHSQRAMAQRYQASYEQRNWQQFGPLPDAISHALNAPENALLASDGHTYSRNAEGHWATPGRVFGTNLADARTSQQLDATMELKQAQSASAPLAANVANGSSATREPSGAETIVARELSPAFRAASETLDRMTAAMDNVDRRLLHKEMESFATSTVGRAFFAQAGISVAKENEYASDSRTGDPRESAHPDHAMTLGIRQKLTALHADAGIYPSSNRIEPLAAAIALHARQNRMTEIGQLQFNADQTSIIATPAMNGRIEGVGSYSITPVQQALQTSPEQSYQQMSQVTQQQAQMDQAMQQQAVQSQQQGPSMGR